MNLIELLYLVDNFRLNLNTDETKGNLSIDLRHYRPIQKE